MLENIARGEVDASAARSEIDRHIEATRDFTKLYSALLRWTWLALSERRMDDDLRHWHRLILDVAARAGIGDTLTADAQLTVGADIAGRLRVLSDLIRVSIGMQARPDKARLLTRAHVPEIMQALYERQSDAVARTDLLRAVGLKTANLSRILTLLILEGLVERQADGRNARFRITREGVECLRTHKARGVGSGKATETIAEAAAIPVPAPMAVKPLPRPEKRTNRSVSTQDLPNLLAAVEAYLADEKLAAKRSEEPSSRAGWPLSSARDAASAEGKKHARAVHWVRPSAKPDGKLRLASKMAWAHRSSGSSEDEMRQRSENVFIPGGLIEVLQPKHREEAFTAAREPYLTKMLPPEYTPFETVLAPLGTAKLVG